MLTQSSRSDSQAEMGAEQCIRVGSRLLILCLLDFFSGIIVRHEAAKQKLIQEVGEVGNIMYEQLLQFTLTFTHSDLKDYLRIKRFRIR